MISQMAKGCLQKTFHWQSLIISVKPYSIIQKTDKNFVFWSLLKWQQNNECCSFAFFRFHFYLTAVRFYNIIA